MPISNTTFDKMKQYVSVRMQQGVPLLDSDWNEKDDIRRYEMRSFIKWFIGDGVPYGNDGFAIKVLKAGSLVLKLEGETPFYTSLKITLSDGSPCSPLGFDEKCYFDQRTGIHKARLYSTGEIDLAQLKDKTLVIEYRDLNDETQIVNIHYRDAHVKLQDVIDSINDKKTIVKAETLVEDCLLICGGDGTPDGAGRILADGFDAVNVAPIAFVDQPLYDNSDLAKKWNVPAITEWSPDKDKIYLVYIDIWDRLVDIDDDNSLENEDEVGTVTCVRLKREWAIRIKEGDKNTIVNEPNLQDHVYLKLAEISCPTSQLSDCIIADLRTKGLKVISTNDFQQVACDAFGEDYVMDTTGMPKLNVSLRDAINALLQGSLPLKSNIPPIKIENADSIKIFEDKYGALWLFEIRNGDISEVKYSKYNAENGWTDRLVYVNDIKKINIYMTYDREEIVCLYVYDKEGKAHLAYTKENTKNGKISDEILIKKIDGKANDITLLDDSVLKDEFGDLWIFVEIHEDKYSHYTFLCNSNVTMSKLDSDANKYNFFKGITDNKENNWLITSTLLGGKKLYYYDHAKREWIPNDINIKNTIVDVTIYNNDVEFTVKYEKKQKTYYDVFEIKTDSLDEEPKKKIEPQENAFKLLYNNIYYLITNNMVTQYSNNMKKKPCVDFNNKDFVCLFEHDKKEEVIVCLRDSINSEYVFNKIYLKI